MIDDRFKFRAWSKSFKGMIDFEPLVEMLSSMIIKNIEADNDLIYMQCTTARDKNKRPIFEGDILKDEKGFLWKVVYRTIYEGYAEMYIICDDLMAKEILGQRAGYVEIVGNIYEDPEIYENPELI